jgi:hypothetical protein
VRERQIAEAIGWQSYVTTAFTSSNWFRDKAVVGWSEALTAPEAAGRLIGARRDTVHGQDLQVYVTGQFGPDRSEAVREGMLRTRDEMQGEQRTWHGGAAFSDELVSSVSQQAGELARSIAARG